MTHVANLGHRWIGARGLAIATALLSGLAAVTEAGAAPAADPVAFAAILSGQGVLPPGGSPGSAIARFEFDSALTSATVTVDYTGLATPFTGFAVYKGGTAGQGKLLLDVSPRNCAVPSPASSVLVCHLSGSTAFPPNGSVTSLATAMDNGGVYAEVTTAGLPSGALGGTVLSATEVHFAGCDTITMTGTNVHMAACSTASM
ncbi:MAG: CHRD domain-containing protein [Myxococcota bacterium]